MAGIVILRLAEDDLLETGSATTNYSAKGKTGSTA